jgi:hypothetical protein
MNEDRERTHDAAVMAGVGAITFIVGAALTKLVTVLLPLGIVLLIFGGLAVVQAVLVGLGVLRMPGGQRDKDRD